MSQVKRISRRIGPFFLLLCGLTLLTPAQAQSFPEWFEAFPLASLERESVTEVRDYFLPLDQINRIQGILRTRNQKMLQGTLIRKTWQLSGMHTPDEGMHHLKNQLLAQNATILYECNSRDCGASNLWANEVFQIASLVGVDNSQFFLAVELPEGHLIAYAIRVGNRNVFLHIDYVSQEQFATGNQSESTSIEHEQQDWQSLLKTQGYVTLREEQAGSLETMTDALVALLLDHTEMTIRLVVHTSQAESLQEVDGDLRRSEQLAEQWREQLSAQGVGAERFSIYGIGALAPEVLENAETAITIISQ